MQTVGEQVLMNSGKVFILPGVGGEPSTFHVLLCKDLMFLGMAELFFVCDQNYGKYTTSCLYYRLLRCSSLVESSFLSKHPALIFCCYATQIHHNLLVSQLKNIKNIF